MVTDADLAFDDEPSDDDEDVEPWPHVSYAPGLWRYQQQGTVTLIEARLSPPRLLLWPMVLLTLTSTALIFVGPGDLFWFFLFFVFFMVPAIVGVFWLYLWESKKGDFLLYDQRERIVRLPREGVDIPLEAIETVQVEEYRGLRSGKLCQVSLSGVDTDGELRVHVVSERIYIRSLNKAARQLATQLGVPLKTTIYDETGVYER